MRTLLVWLSIATGLETTLASPDDNCVQNRICEFSSEKAYDAVLETIMGYTGCPLACIGQSTCTCNTSGPVYDALTSTPVPYCTSPICIDPVVVRALNFPAEQYECDALMAIALQSLYQLCGRTNGECRNGACTDFSCISTVYNACRTQKGIGREPAYIIAALAGTIMILFLWGWTELTIVDDEVISDDDKVSPHSKKVEYAM